MRGSRDPSSIKLRKGKRDEVRVEAEGLNNNSSCAALLLSANSDNASDTHSLLHNLILSVDGACWGCRPPVCCGGDFGLALYYTSRKLWAWIGSVACYVEVESLPQADKLLPQYTARYDFMGRPPRNNPVTASAIISAVDCWGEVVVVMVTPPTIATVAEAAAAAATKGAPLFGLMH